MKRESKRSLPQVSTASLPDIVFMLLFFFMVTTVLRPVDLKVKLEKPQAEEVQKLENKEEIGHLYIGKPLEAERYGDLPRVQLNDAFVDKRQLLTFAEELDQANHPERIVSINVDRGVEMGVVTDVKQILRKGNALRIAYSALPDENE